MDGDHSDIVVSMNPIPLLSYRLCPESPSSGQSFSYNNLYKQRGLSVSSCRKLMIPERMAAINLARTLMLLNLKAAPIRQQIQQSASTLSMMSSSQFSLSGASMTPIRRPKSIQRKAKHIISLTAPLTLQAKSISELPGTSH